MKGNHVPDSDHILRYVGGNFVDQTDTGESVILGGGFIARPKDDNKPSYNWLECLSGTLNEQVAQVRATARLQYGSKAKLVRLNVGDVRKHLAENTDDNRAVAVIHDPLDAEDGKPADVSHALMTNIPDEDDPIGETIGDLIAQRVLEIFPARAPYSSWP